MTQYTAIAVDFEEGFIGSRPTTTIEPYALLDELSLEFGGMDIACILLVLDNIVVAHYQDVYD